MGFFIRSVCEADAEKILEIYSHYITDTVISFETEVPSFKSFKERINSIKDSFPYIVCELDGCIVGYAYASAHRERAAYKFSVDVSVYVAAEQHGKGIGKALYAKLFELLENQGFFTAYAGITLPNKKSIGLHKAFGFNEVGVYHKVGYKQGKWLDVIWLEKPLREYDKPNK